MAESNDKKTPEERPKKADLVAEAIRRGVPSYEAWAMTVQDLDKKLKEF